MTSGLVDFNDGYDYCVFFSCVQEMTARNYSKSNLCVYLNRAVLLLLLLDFPSSKTLRPVLRLHNYNTRGITPSCMSPLYNFV